MDLDFKHLSMVMRSLAEEKNIPLEVLQEIIETALSAAYRRDFGERTQNIQVKMDMNTGDVTAAIVKNIVDTVEDENVEISLADAKKIRKSAEVGEELSIPLPMSEFGRVAAQTAKQVILQKLREAEKEIIANEYQDKVGTIINGVVGRVERSVVRVDLGKASAIMPYSEQIQGEHFRAGERIRVYLKNIEREVGRAPQVIVSRGASEFIVKLFEAEVPEMEAGGVEIKGIAREAGVRTKLAVSSNTPGVDPVGTFVGGHGTRVNAVISEIGDREKIDIIVWDENPITFISNALSPTKVNNVVLDTGNKIAKVIVPEDQLSIAIGRGGQNVRLAAKLTGYEIDIEAEKKTSLDETEKPKLKKKSDLENSLLEAIDSQGE